ncbi:MAG: hypothetical protein IKC69_05190, partial [Clostridia bacterium]|nr:hypothetical protein [Clostridia bacterium]
LAFWLPEGVQRYVEWRSLFVAKNAFFYCFYQKTGFSGRFIPKNPFCFIGIGGLRFFYIPFFKNVTENSYSSGMMSILPSGRDPDPS